MEQELRSFITADNERISVDVTKCNLVWAKINDEYFERIEKILKIRIPDTESYRGLITHTHSCPFYHKGRWFMVRRNDLNIDAIAAHELMHIIFLLNYEEQMFAAGLDQKQLGDLREALTVLLNEEMGNLLSREDVGYLEHAELRNKITTEWRKHKDFHILLEKMVKIIKG